MSRRHPNVVRILVIVAKLNHARFWSEIDHTGDTYDNQQLSCNSFFLFLYSQLQDFIRYFPISHVVYGHVWNIILRLVVSINYNVNVISLKNFSCIGRISVWKVLIIPVSKKISRHCLKFYGWFLYTFRRWSWNAIRFFYHVGGSYKNGIKFEQFFRIYNILFYLQIRF